METAISRTTKPAGFWIRLLGYTIDSVFLIIIIFAACSVLGFPTLLDLVTLEPGAAPPAGIWSTAGLAAAVGTIWHAIFESSKWQATIGKKLLGLRVTNMNGERIGFFRAVVRYIPKLLIIAVFPVGMAIVAFNANKRGIHDFIAGSKVYNLRSSVDAPDQQA